MYLDVPSPSERSRMPQVQTTRFTKNVRIIVERLVCSSCGYSNHPNDVAKTKQCGLCHGPLGKVPLPETVN